MARRGKILVSSEQAPGVELKDGDGDGQDEEGAKLFKKNNNNNNKDNNYRKSKDQLIIDV